jgi:UDP-perosamine 4-acetyltransferase
VTDVVSEEAVVLVGTGGHARVCAELLVERGFRLAGCTGPEPPRRGTFDAPFLGPDARLAELFDAGYRRCFVAVGDNARRGRLIAEVGAIGYSLVNAISAAAVLSPTVALGRGVAIMPGAVINAGTVLDDGSVVNTGAAVDHDCVVGRLAHVAPRVAVAGWVHIGEGAFLGIGCAVVDKVRIGDWTIVGAGAAVIDDLPSGVTAVGVPARPVRTEQKLRA